MSTNPPAMDLHDERAKKLGKEITKLYGLITAATYELLVKIRDMGMSLLLVEQSEASSGEGVE